MSRRALTLALLIAALLSTAASSRRSFETGVVALNVTYQVWDEDRPWAKRAPQSRRFLATVVEGPYLLTSSQMVADATLIEVEKLGLASRVSAKVTRIDHDADLALLSVDAEGFFDDLRPVRLADAVPLEGSVESVRWRARQIEVSTSRVSRIEVQPSFTGSVEYPSLFVTTDLRGGGWSEPVFAGGRFVGITVSQDEQTARVLPVDLIATFLDMAREGEGYPGFASLGIRWQVNEDRAVAEFLGLPGEPRGIVVTSTPAGGSAHGVLRPKDILVSLDGHAIDGSGYYRHPRYGLLRYTSIATNGHRAGDILRAVVWREGKPLEIDLPLRRASVELDLVPERRPETPPAYVVAGGLLFRELDGAYLRSWGDDWRKKAPVPLLVWQFLFSEEQTSENRRIVILSSVMPSAYNMGYHDIGDVAVRSINGRPIDSVADVDEAFRHPEGEFHRIALYPNPLRSEIILDATTFERETSAILEEYRIPDRIRLPRPLPPLW